MASLRDVLTQISEPFVLGAQGTLGAMRSDIDRLRSGHLPTGLMDALGQMWGAYGGPGMIPRMAIPKYTTAGSLSRALDKFTQDNPALRDVFKIDEPIPTGKFDTPLGTFLSGSAPGSIGAKAKSLRDLFLKGAEELGEVSNITPASKAAAKQAERNAQNIFTRSSGKTFTPGPSWKLAPEGVEPLTPVHKMNKVLINQKTGEMAVVPPQGWHPYGIFKEHGEIRAFGDPITGLVFPESFWGKGK